MGENKEYYDRLGKLLNKHLNGEILSHGELVAIVTASKDDCILALELNAMDRLSKKNDGGLDNMLKNTYAMKQIESIKIPNEKTR